MNAKEAKFEIEKLHGGMDYWKEQAEAAEKELKAIKEKLENPTAEMIEAGEDLFPWPMGEVVERKNIPTSLAVFKAMIDEAKE